MRRRLRLLVPLLALLAPPSAAGCAAPTEEPSATETAKLSEGDAVVNVDGLNLRAGPGTDTAVILVMSRGARVRVRGDGQNGFVPVTYGDRSGWAFAEYLKAVGPTDRTSRRSLGDTVRALVDEAGERSPGTELGIAVRNLSTGEYAGAGDDVRHVSASSAKVLWVAAAIHAGAGVSDIAPGIFRDSDNHLSGVAIDRAGGLDAVNEFYAKAAGMERSLAANWSFGKRRVASTQGELGGDNYFTAKDVVTFLSRLESRALLGDRTDELRTYMTWSPRSGYGGWVGALLPEAARAKAMHKAGWLPPPDYAAYSTLNEVAVVQVPGGHRYAVALLARHGRDYARQARFVERASCVVYRTVAGDGSLACRD